jgi:hypothetical protein
MTLDDLILALMIHRDNQGGQCPVTIYDDGEEKTMNLVTFGTAEGFLGPITTISFRNAERIVGKPNVNHYPEFPAREADDLRKLAHQYLHFRQAVCEYALNRNKKYDPEDPDRFKRLRKQMIETARDMRFTMGHIDGDCER